MIVNNKGDWPEDLAHENGRYVCECLACHRQFMGHKRRVICKECHDEGAREVPLSGDVER